jgi:hypothetical protein
MKIRVIKHEVVPDCGSYEVRFPDGRPSKYFYFENRPTAGCDLIGSNKRSPKRMQRGRREELPFRGRRSA